MMAVKRSDVYFHDGNLITLCKGIEQTDKKFYARDDLSSRMVYALQEDGRGVPICRVSDLEDDTDPFPRFQPQQRSGQELADALLDEAVAERQKR